MSEKVAFVRAKRGKPFGDGSLPQLVDKSTLSTRLECYQSLLQDLDAIITRIDTSVNENLLETVTQTVEEQLSAWSAQQGPFGTMPTVLVTTGSNMRDASRLFESLLERLRGDARLLVHYRPSGADTSIRSILGQVCGDFWDQYVGGTKQDVSTKVARPETFSELLHSMEMRGKGGKREGKKSKKKISAGQTELLLIIDSMELIPPALFQDFMRVASSVIDRIPLAVVIGIGAVLNSVERYLPYAVRSTLRIYSIYAPPASRYLCALVTDLIGCPTFPFMLSPELFDLLKNLFLQHTFSLAAFVKAFKLAMFHHFSLNVFSILCREPEKLTARCVQDVLRGLPKPVVANLAKEFGHKSVPKDRTELAESIVHHCSDFFGARFKFCSAVDVLFALARHLQFTRWGSQQYLLHAAIFEDTPAFFVDPAYADFLQRLSALGSEGLMEVALMMHDMLSDQTCEFYFEPQQDLLRQFAVNFRDAEAKQAEIDDQAALDAAQRRAEKVGRENSVGSSAKKENWRSVKARLRQNMIEKQQPAANDYLAAERQKFLDFVDNFFRQNLVVFGSLAGSNCFVINDGRPIARCLIANPQLHMVTTLTSPEDFARRHFASLPTDFQFPELPISTACRLLQEEGKMVDVAAFFDCFSQSRKMALEGCILRKEKKRGKGKRAAVDADSENLDDTIEAEFLQCMDELEWLGLLKRRNERTFLKIQWPLSV